MSNVVVQKAVISLEYADKMIKRALERAVELEKNVAIAVVDDGGYLIAFARMDDANPSTVKIALDKAFTAATTRIATHKWFDIIENDAPLRAGAAIGVERLIVFGGGQPIMHEGMHVGAIGVSGGHWTGDTDIGSAALAILEAS
ncbi:MAG: heme-binding protein [Pseudomonadota bacterium]